MLRRLVFALPELSQNLMFASVNGWFLYYLVTVLGLSPALAGAVFLIGRVLDAVLDVPVGFLSDRMARRGGRVRLIGVSLPLAACAFVVMWLAPAMGTSHTVVFLAATAGFSLFALFYTLVAVPRIALLPGYVRTRPERIRQVAIDMVVAWFAVGMASAAFPALVGQAARHTEAPLTWGLAAAVVAVIGLAFYLPFLLRVDDRMLHPQGAEAPLTLRQGLARLRRLRQRLPFGRFFLLVLAPFLLQSVLPFYVSLHIGLPAEQQFPVLGAVFATALLAFPVWSRIAQRVSARSQTLAALGITACALVVMPFLPAGLSAPIFALAVICGAGLSGLALAAWVLIPQTVDRAQQMAEAPGEGLTSAAFTFINKLAAGGAAMINGIALSLVPPRAGGGDSLIGWAASLPALACCLIAAALLLRGAR